MQTFRVQIQPLEAVPQLGQSVLEIEADSMVIAGGALVFRDAAGDVQEAFSPGNWHWVGRVLPAIPRVIPRARPVAARETAKA